MAEDIAPELLKKIQDMFRSGIDQDQRVAELKEKLDAGSATYHEAHEYASLVGGHMKDAYMEYLTSDNLPDGKCYYNIAERIIGTTEHEQYELVSQYAQEVQTALNKNAGIGMKAQAAGEDTTRVEGLVNVASNADQYDQVAKTVAQGVESMAREVVDRSVEKNAGFQRQSGLRPKIIRSSGGKCCDWCAALDGTYDYDKAPKEIYARHNNCTCTVEYDPGSGRRQDVWSKRWISEEELAKREELKTLGLDNLSGSDKIEARKHGAKGVYRKEGSFESKADPMADAFGPGIVSNPKEIEEFRKTCSDLGVEIIEREKESLSYQPNPIIGKPGQLTVSSEASYAGWCHEMQHMYDDRDSGWDGAIRVWDKDEHYAREVKAYGVEIKMAEELGREDIADKLRANLEEERKIIYGD